jgi:hypothetical protein
VFRTMLSIRKRPDMSADEFRDYYERRHIRLMAGLLQERPLQYRRAYLLDDDPLSMRIAAGRGDQAETAVSAVTEIAFADRASAERLVDQMLEPSRLAAMLEDEARFIAPHGVSWRVIEVRD